MGLFRTLFGRDTAPPAKPAPVAPDPLAGIPNVDWGKERSPAQWSVAAEHAAIRELVTSREWTGVAAALSIIGTPNPGEVVEAAKARLMSPCDLACYAIHQVYKSINDSDRDALRSRLAATAPLPPKITPQQPAQVVRPEVATPADLKPLEPNKPDPAPEDSEPAMPVVQSPKRPAPNWDAIRAARNGAGAQTGGRVEPKPPVLPGHQPVSGPKTESGGFRMASEPSGALKADVEAALLALGTPKQVARTLAYAAARDAKPGSTPGEVVKLAISMRRK